MPVVIHTCVSILELSCNLHHLYFCFHSLRTGHFPHLLLFLWPLVRLNQHQRNFVEPEVYFLRAMCYALQHQHKLAVKDFDKAYEANAMLKRRAFIDHEVHLMLHGYVGSVLFFFLLVFF